MEAVRDGLKEILDMAAKIISETEKIIQTTTKLANTLDAVTSVPAKETEIKPKLKIAESLAGTGKPYVAAILTYKPEEGAIIALLNENNKAESKAVIPITDLPGDAIKFLMINDVSDARVKVKDDYVHIQAEGTKINRDYGVAFDIPAEKFPEEFIKLASI